MITRRTPSPAGSTSRAWAAWRQRSVLAAWLTGALLISGCAGDPGQATDQPAPSPEPVVPASPTPDPEDVVLDAYRAWNHALVVALYRSDPDLPALQEHGAGSALQQAQQRIRDNQARGVVEIGSLRPSPQIQRLDLHADPPTATVTDCYLDDLRVVRDEFGGEVLKPATGDRVPATATLTRNPTGWQVTELQGPQKHQGCAPPELAEELIRSYEAWFDAFYAAADPPNPDHPGLAATSVDPQLGDLQALMTELRDRGHVLRGRPQTHPTVLAVFEYDTKAVIFDCVTEVPGAGNYDAHSGQLVDAGHGGSHSVDITEMVRVDGVWKVANLDVEEGLQCDPSQ